MMENVDISGQEEYIWAMRSVVREVSDYDLWLSTPQEADCRVLHELNHNETFSKISKVVKIISSTELDFEAQVLASLVPDEIIYDSSNFSRRPYEVCLLFGNISGFTSLCDKLNKSGKGGPSRLTPILNGYIGKMVQEILSYGADIIHLSGESFLVMFKLTAVTTLADCVHLAIDCALAIQKTYGFYETDSGVNIRLKLNIAAGDVIFSVVGFSDLCNYVVVGRPVNDIKFCDRRSNFGEIMVSQSAWEYVNPTEYHVEYYEGGTLIKVHGLGLNWRSPLRTGRTEKVVQENDSKSNSLEDISEADDLSLRQSVVDAIKMGIKKELRKFISKVIIRAIDMVEPLDYLTEMRQIVTIFMNVVIEDLPLVDLAKLVDKCYKIVLSVSDSMEGTLTKISLYEKDLMFVVAFGFRGFKHENECQLALRCAAECSRRLKSLSDVFLISIGVTSGMAYCGIVGHNLRREFTMLGQSVTKSLRLMTVYTGKVTCDRDTFLHSKMEAKNFILQEYRVLMDVTKAGPIYEFNETMEARGMARVMTKFPLLGRDEEMDIYMRILKGVTRESKYFINHRRSSTTNIMKTVLHISANAKQGKSRLMDEFICITSDDIPISRYSLIPPNHSDPYYTTRQMFSLPLDIVDPSSVDDRKLKITSRLRYMLVPELICVLNPVFQVDFPLSDLYNTLTKREKHIALTKMIKQLCYGTFPHVWSIMIENGEYIDKESWKIIGAMSETTLVCITLTTCALNLNKDECIEYLIDNPRVLHLHLKPLDKWFHVGFACQILGVYAIPPELEKVIQVKSNGNAGWIESFLISLLQGGSLYIEDVEKTAIDDLGLVTPPIEMLLKSSKKDISTLKVTSRARNATNMRGWRMYVNAYRDSNENLQKFHLLDKLLGPSDTVPVCFIAPGINIFDVENELSAEVFLMKTFDTLTSFEQRLLKCSAVIGYTLHRRMLEYVMNTKDILAMALAVKKLFEIKIMCCNRGDFQQGDTFALSQKRSFFNIKYDIDNSRNGCECLGIRISDKLSKDIPVYAMCGFLRFKDFQFRDIMYTLLTDQQKREFHSRAMQYLEIETRKCRSCGHGVFTHILGKKHTHNDEFNRIRFIKQHQRMKKAMLEDHQSQSIQLFNNSQMYSDENTVLKRMKSCSSERRGTTTSLQSEAISRVIVDVNEGSEDYLIPKFRGITTVKANRYRHTLLKHFSNYDFSFCECPEILDTMYKQMMDHCIGAGLKEKLLLVMLEYAHLCIFAHNVPMALQILNAALDHVNTKSLENEHYLKNWKTPITRAEVYTLKGFAASRVGQREEASRIYYKAMFNFGYPFPANPNRLSIKSKLMYLKIISALLCCRKGFIHSKIGGQALFCDNMSVCLTHMCNNFLVLKQFQHAKLAATWSLYNALCADQDFPIIANAYANMIRIMNHYNKDNVCVALEVHALCMCHRKRLSVERDDLWSVVRLYTAIFRARFQRSEISRAIEIGYVILRICETINDRESTLHLYPLLVQALIMECKVIDVVYLLTEMELKSEEDLDYSGKVWYYALAIAVHLETGYCVQTYKACEQFLNIEGEHVNCYRDPDAKRRYFTVMWLWNMRIRDYEAASTWQVKAYDTTILQEQDTIENQITALYHLEGLLLYMSDKSNRKNLVNVANCHSATDHLIQLLTKASNASKVIEARLWHLKAFYRNIRYDDKRTYNILKIARDIAIKRGNIIEQLWIAHSDLAWSHELNNLKRNFWRDHANQPNTLDYHEYEQDACNIVPFTLEPPLYV